MLPRPACQQDGTPSPCRWERLLSAALGEAGKLMREKGNSKQAGEQRKAGARTDGPHDPTDPAPPWAPTTLQSASCWNSRWNRDSTLRSFPTLRAPRFICLRAAEGRPSQSLSPSPSQSAGVGTQARARHHLGHSFQTCRKGLRGAVVLGGRRV